ncbi:MAG: glycosyltransferase family 87 protein [Alphaproteobacteria bacterium]|nr:glycosyltransferase family 87 protein [Alphaproteobacteria bacterium]
MNRRPWVPVCVTLAGAVLAVLLWPVLAPTPDSGLDFLNYWGAPQLARQDIHVLFAGRGYEQALHQLHPHDFAELRWSYPLHSLFFFAPFAALPYTAALLLWSLLGLLAYLAVMRAALPPGVPRRAWSMWLAFSPVAMVVLLSGQNGFFIGAAALAVPLMLARGHPVLAGAVLGCLTIKPQLFILWPLMLLLDRQWRCLAAASVTALGLVAASLWVHGLTAWQEFFAVVPALQWRILSAEQFEESRKLAHLMMPGVLPALRLLGVGDTLACGVQILVSVGVALGTARAWRRPMRLPRRVVLLASASLLVSPYGFNYDLTLLSAALLLLWADGAPRTRYEAWLHGAVYLLPLLVYVLNLVAVPLAPVLLLLLWGNSLRAALTAPTAPT